MPKGATIDFDSTRPPSPFLKDTHHAWRRELRRFIDREIVPYVEEWEEAEEIPLSLYKKASDFGLLRMGYPEALWRHLRRARSLSRHRDVRRIVAHRGGRGDRKPDGARHRAAADPRARQRGDESSKIAPAVLAGDKRISLAITEPSGGSDVAQLKTRARRDGDHFVVDGSKMFITGGMRADYFTTAVRTGGEGLGGVSLLLIEADTPGVSRTKLKKQGWWASDTAALYFDSVRVPAENLIGGENQGFLGIMHNFNGERLGMAAGATRFGARVPRRSREMGATARDLRQAPRRSSGDPSQDRGDGAPDQRDDRLSRNVRVARDERRRRRRPIWRCSRCRRH